MDYLVPVVAPLRLTERLQCRKPHPGTETLARQPRLDSNMQSALTLEYRPLTYICPARSATRLLTSRATRTRAHRWLVHSGT